MNEDYDYKYALEIMEQELNNIYISAEVKYSFKASIKALELLIKYKKELIQELEDLK